MDARNDVRDVVVELLIKMINCLLSTLYKQIPNENA